MKRNCTRWCQGILVLGLVAWLGLGTAQADSFSDARKAYKSAESDYAKGAFSKAAEGYRAAFRMSRAPVLLFNIAQSLRRQFQKDGNYDHLVEATKLYKEFIDKANPDPRERALADENLAEVRALSVDEAKRRFANADQAMKASQFSKALSEYDASYELSGYVPVLYNMAQAHRRQFEVDGKLEHLAKAEALVRSYRSSGGSQVDPTVLEELLSDLSGQRQEYQRKREAEARSQESKEMRSARTQYEQGDGKAALASLEIAHNTPGISRLELVQMYRLRGQAAMMAGDQAQAVDAFKRYLALEPAADGTGISEQSSPAFAAAKEYWSQRIPLTVEHLPPGTVAPKKKVVVPIRIASDPMKMIEQRELRYRREGADSWTTLSMRNETLEVELPANPMPKEGKEYKMQYYITATDSKTAELHTLGTAKAPLAFLVSKDAIVRPPPLYKRWWFWAGAGAVLAGSITTYAIIKSNELPAVEVGDVSEGLR